MLVSKRKEKDIDQIFKFYNSVKDGEERKWKKSFFQNIVGNENTFFLYSFPAKGYLIFSLSVESIDVIALAIDEDYRKNGIATKLLEKMIILARENHANKAFLEVSACNLAAIKLYQKFGFSKIGIRRNYYQKKNEKQDAILMKLDIS